MSRFAVTYLAVIIIITDTAQLLSYHEIKASAFAISDGGLTDHCFYGTTDSCQFSCHCRNGAACNKERSESSGSCPDGCSQSAASGGTWSRAGCLQGNVALGQEATQTNPSSRFTGVNDAANCVDGNRGDDEEAGSCCGVNRTGEWMLDLGDLYVIDSVKIYSSKQRPEFIKNLIIDIGVDVNGGEPMPKCATATVNKTSHRPMLVRCREPLIGQYIAIYHPGWDNEHASPIHMCEVEAIGYKYSNCSLYNGEYYYGPGCLLNCHCNDACDVINGTCATSCRAGYFGDPCQRCHAGYWGDGCQYQCNCQDQEEACFHETGECSVSGCAPGFTGEGCDLELPSVVGVPMVQSWKGRTVQMACNISADIAPGTNVGFGIKYKAIGTDVWRIVAAHYKLESGRLLVWYDIPQDGRPYEIEVVAYDQVHNYAGDPSARIILQRSKSKSNTIYLILILVLPFMLWMVIVFSCCGARRVLKSRTNNNTEPCILTRIESRRSNVSDRAAPPLPAGVSDGSRSSDSGPTNEEDSASGKSGASYEALKSISPSLHSGSNALPSSSSNSDSGNHSNNVSAAPHASSELPQLASDGGQTYYSSVPVDHARFPSVHLPGELFPRSLSYPNVGKVERVAVYLTTVLQPLETNRQMLKQPSKDCLSAASESSYLSECDHDVQMH